MQHSEGFPPIARPDARVLVLGSLPGQRSLAAQQYYAHPKNAFWSIMHALLGIEGSYFERCAQLIENRIALWDVLLSSARSGSMDADIQLDTARVNDFVLFFDRHPAIRVIAFNGKKAEQLFRRFVDSGTFSDSIQLIALPSTSPAYAAMSFSVKLSAWREAICLSEAGKSDKE